MGKGSYGEPDWATPGSNAPGGGGAVESTGVPTSAATGAVANGS